MFTTTIIKIQESINAATEYLVSISGLTPEQLMSSPIGILRREDIVQLTDDIHQIHATSSQLEILKGMVNTLDLIYDEIDKLF